MKGSAIVFMSLSLFFFVACAHTTEETNTARVPAQECPGGYCPPAKYSLTVYATTSNSLVTKLQTACQEKGAGDVPSGYKRFLNLKNIEVLWDNEKGLYAEGLCLVHLMPVR